MMTFQFRRPAMLGMAALVLASGLAACDLEVASPIRVEESNLDDYGLIETMLRGTEGDLAYAASGEIGMGGIFMAGALLTDELVHSGLMAGLRNFSDGTQIDPNHTEVNELWAHASQARYTSEQLVARIERLITQHSDSADLVQTLTNQLALANLWAGFSNRLMGDTFCNAVISENGEFGTLQPHTVFYERAIPYFTRAAELFTEGATGGEDALEAQLWAAYGGRAQAHLGLRQYDEAAADAERWTRNATFTYRHAAWTGREREWNFLFRHSLFANAQATVWGTPFVSPVGRDQTSSSNTVGDPRLRYDRPSGKPLGSDNRRPFWRQRKYLSTGGDVSIANWRDMKLIEAEYLLRQGDVTGMLDKIEEIRADWNSTNKTTTTRITPIRPTIPEGVDADSAAWAILIRERGVALWLEGRRLPDMRRWQSDPETMWSHRLLTQPDGPFTVVRRATGATPAEDERLPVLDVEHDMCLPVSGHEQRTNPNL